MEASMAFPMTDMLTKRQLKTVLAGVLAVLLAGYASLDAAESAGKKRGTHPDGRTEQWRAARAQGTQGSGARSGAQTTRIISIGGYRMPTSGSGTGASYGTSRRGYNGRQGEHNTHKTGQPPGQQGRNQHGCRGLGASAGCTEANPGRGRGGPHSASVDTAPSKTGRADRGNIGGGRKRLDGKHDDGNKRKP